MADNNNANHAVWRKIFKLDANCIVMFDKDCIRIVDKNQAFRALIKIYKAS